MLPWMSQFKSVHWTTEHWFSELADGINAMAGESNALCTVKRQLSCISIQEPVTGLQCRRRFAVTWTGSQLVTLTTSKHVFPDG